MSNYNFNFNTVLDLLWNNNFNEALKICLLNQESQQDNNYLLLTSWALLENGFVNESINFLNKSNFKNFNSFHYLISSYILYRVSNFEKALEYVDVAIKKNTEYILWAKILKSRIHAYLHEYYEAYSYFSNEVCNYVTNSDILQMKKWFGYPAGYIEDIFNNYRYNVGFLIDQAIIAFEKGEYWFILWLYDQLFFNVLYQKNHPEIQKLYINSLVNLYQFDKLNELFNTPNYILLNTNEIKEINYNIQQKYNLSITNLEQIIKKFLSSSSQKLTLQPEKTIAKIEENKIISPKISNDNLSNTVLSEDELLSLLGVKSETETLQQPLTNNIENNEIIKIIDIKIYSLLDNILNNQKVYFSQINPVLKYIGIDIAVEISPELTQNHSINLKIVGKCDNTIYDEKSLNFTLSPSWNKIIFDTNLGQDNSILQGSNFTVELYTEDKLIFSKNFAIGDDIIIDDDSNLSMDLPLYSKEHLLFTSDDKLEIDFEKLKLSQIDLVLKELDNFVGLKKVKETINDFVAYLEYINERKKLGLKSSDNINYHCVFLGNPGTGKTSVARVLAKIFHAMEILEKGHLIETDRAGLVGQYVGETAQKTDKVIQDALGGVLFIDEAYSLFSKGNSNDFGKEAIDILLKRLEDYKGKFIVIVAGYTDEMNDFLEANPGMKSRFNHYFYFEDYTPDELKTIFINLLNKEDFKIEDNALQELHKYFIELYRTRDKSFGNARLVRNIFEEIKMNVSKRFLQIPPNIRKPEDMVTIRLVDIEKIIKPKEKVVYQISMDEDALEKELKKLNSLIGLDSVKLSIEKLISSLKVAKIREAQGLKVIRKNLHSVFLGNPGTGKTTVARLLSNIFKTLGFLEKGHLVEVDRSQLVAGYVGQTAIKTDEIIQKALGGTLFIDEAYTLVRSANDFGIEAVETLLKRMEDYKEDFVVIVAGYPDEMKKFLETNPGLQSRFTNYFIFEDYTPRQMLEIALSVCEKSGYKLDEGAWQATYDIFEYLYNNRDKNFGNARTVQNFIHKAISNQEERIIREGKTSKEDLMLILYEDVNQINPETLLI